MGASMPFDLLVPLSLYISVRVRAEENRAYRDVLERRYPGVAKSVAYVLAAREELHRERGDQASTYEIAMRAGVPVRCAWRVEFWGGE